MQHSTLARELKSKDERAAVSKCCVCVLGVCVWRLGRKVAWKIDKQEKKSRGEKKERRGAGQNKA